MPVPLIQQPNRPKPQPIGMAPLEDVSNTPSIVQHNRDRFRRLTNDPRATSGLQRAAHEPAIVFNRRQQAMAQTDRFQLNRVQQPQGQQPIAPRDAAGALVQQAALAQAEPFQVGAAPVLPASEFFGNADPAMTLRSQRTMLRQMGPQGQAAERFLEKQLRAFKRNFGKTLAGVNKAELSEDEFTALAQTTDGFHPAIQGDVAEHLEANMPENLKAARNENKALEQKRIQTANESERRNAISLRAGGMDELATMLEQGVEPSPEEVAELQARGFEFLDAAGRPIPEDPEAVAQREDDRRFEQTQRANTESLRVTREQQAIEAGAANEAFGREQEALGRPFDPENPFAGGGVTTDKLIGTNPTFAARPPSKADAKREKEQEEFAARDQEFRTLQQQADTLNTASKGKGEQAKIFADKGKPVLLTGEKARDAAREGLPLFSDRIRQEQLAKADAGRFVKNNSRLAALPPEKRKEAETIVSKITKQLFSSDDPKEVYVKFAPLFQQLWKLQGQLKEIKLAEFENDFEALRDAFANQ